MMKKTGFALHILLVLLMTESGNTQIAKIQRQTAVLDVQPEILINSETITVSVHPYEKGNYQLLVVNSDGDIVEQRDLEALNTPYAGTISVADIQNQAQVLLQIEVENGWKTVAYKSASLLPDLHDEIKAVIDEVEGIEQDTSDSRQIQTAWAVLAHAYDLLERAKNPVNEGGWYFSGQLEELKRYAKALKSGQDPFAGQSGYQLRGYRSELNGEIQFYSLYVPEGYDPAREWPLVVMLHGAWSNHHLGLRRAMGKTNRRAENDASAKRTMPELPDVPYLVVAPNGYETMAYEGFAEADVLRVMNEVKSLFNVDNNRSYLTGLSMGGGGTGRIGMRYPDLFAAIAPVCGYFEADVRSSETRPAPWQQMKDTYSTLALAENALHLPVKLMHGEEDSVVPVEQSKKMHQQLQELGYQSEIELYPGVGHDAWVNAYEDARVFEWFSQFERDPAPDHVIYKTGNPNGGSSYWVRIHEPRSIREMARIEATAKPGRVDVKTENVRMLSLSFPHSFLHERDSIKIYIDGEMVIEGGYQNDTRNFIYKEGQWQHTLDAPPDELIPGLHGLYQASMNRHVYVYSDTGNEKSNQITKTLATLKSVPRDHEDVQWPVIAESDLTPEIIENNHIILFADRGSEIIKDLMAANTSASRSLIDTSEINDTDAISFIMPNPENHKRYIQVNMAPADKLERLRAFAQYKPFLSEMVFPDVVRWNQGGGIAGLGLYDKNWSLQDFETLDEPIQLN